MSSLSEVSTPKDIPLGLLEYLEKTVTRWVPGIKYSQYYKIMESLKNKKNLGFNYLRGKSSKNIAESPAKTHFLFEEY